MNRRKAYFLIALILSLSVSILLITGSSLLTIALDNNKSIPLGTFITWIGMISLPLTIYWGIEQMRNPSTRLNGILSKFLKIVVVLGILWVPLSYLLAGNLSFSFSEKETFQGGQVAMRWFWFLIYGIVIATFLTLIIYWISLLFKNHTPNANN